MGTVNILDDILADQDDELDFEYAENKDDKEVEPFVTPANTGVQHAEKVPPTSNGAARSSHHSDHHRNSRRTRDDRGDHHVTSRSAKSEPQNDVDRHKERTHHDDRDRERDRERDRDQHHRNLDRLSRDNHSSARPRTSPRKEITEERRTTSERKFTAADIKQHQTSDAHGTVNSTKSNEPSRSSDVDLHREAKKEHIASSDSKAKDSIHREENGTASDVRRPRSPPKRSSRVERGVEKGEETPRAPRDHGRGDFFPRRTDDRYVPEHRKQADTRASGEKSRAPERTPRRSPPASRPRTVEKPAPISRQSSTSKMSESERPRERQPEEHGKAEQRSVRRPTPDKVQTRTPVEQPERKSIPAEIPNKELNRLNSDERRSDLMDIDPPSITKFQSPAPMVHPERLRALGISADMLNTPATKLETPTGSPINAPSRNAGSEQARASPISERLGPRIQSSSEPATAQKRKRGREELEPAQETKTQRPRVETPSERSMDTPERRQSSSKPIRYFVLSCPTYAIMKTCQEIGIFATTPANSRKLSEAFGNSRHVILFFTVKNSRRYQGYARMTSDIGCIEADLSIFGEGVDKPFGIKWARVGDVHQGKAHNIENKMNDRRPLKECEDGEEISADAGDRFCRLLDDECKFDSVPPLRPPPVLRPPQAANEKASQPRDAMARESVSRRESANNVQQTREQLTRRQSSEQVAQPHPTPAPSVAAPRPMVHPSRLAQVEDPTLHVSGGPRLPDPAVPDRFARGDRYTPTRPQPPSTSTPNRNEPPMRRPEGPRRPEKMQRVDMRRSDEPRNQPPARNEEQMRRDMPPRRSEPIRRESFPPPQQEEGMMRRTGPPRREELMGRPEPPRRASYPPRGNDMPRRDEPPRRDEQVHRDGPVRRESMMRREELNRREEFLRRDNMPRMDEGPRSDDRREEMSRREGLQRREEPVRPDQGMRNDMRREEPGRKESFPPRGGGPQNRDRRQDEGPKQDGGNNGPRQSRDERPLPRRGPSEQLPPGRRGQARMEPYPPPHMRPNRESPYRGPPMGRGGPPSFYHGPPPPVGAPFPPPPGPPPQGPSAYRGGRGGRR